MEKNWSGLPFYPISEFYKQRFGEKVYKVPVSVADDCPNRQGLKGMKTCSFCDVWGSAARAESLQLDLETQLEKYKKHIGAQYNSRKFLIYFQSYTTTFQSLARLKKAVETSQNFSEVVGLVLGTRPDCLSPALFSTLAESAEKYFVSVEMGAQSFHEPTLEFYRRGHTGADTRRAIESLAKIPKLDLSLHLIFGGPYETPEMARETALICNDLPIHSVKLHNLHVLKGTHLETLWNQGDYQPVDFETYAESVRVFLENLRPDIAVHRLAAYASRWDELIAPAWTADRMRTHQGLVDHLRARHSVQSLTFTAHSVPHQQARQNLLARRFSKAAVNTFV
jgi:uncharacterized protein